MQLTDLTDISYLNNGSATQREVYQVLTSTRILDKLSAYDPIVVGTFPLDIQTRESDVDIICHCPDLGGYADQLQQFFGNEANFSVRLIGHLSKPAVVATFDISHLPFEIFGQDIPTREQNGYKHMIIEQAVLAHFGEEFKHQIIALKENGVKTEPAFCQLLGIDGDPYEELLLYRLPEG